MTWTITFYSEKVKKETLALPASIQANFFRITELIEEFGPDLGRPQTAPLGGGLFEIRAKGKERYSTLCFLHSERTGGCDPSERCKEVEQIAQTPYGNGAKENEGGSG